MTNFKWTDEGKLIDRLDKWPDSDLDSDLGGASDDENDLEQDFDEDETQVKDATYVFCPAPHQKQILHLFTKHFCQHPSFPECNEGSCSAAEICEHAVMENFWKQLKHNHLHHMLRPRLDLLVWILIVKVTPEYISHAEVLEDTHRLGCSKPLLLYQKLRV